MSKKQALVLGDSALAHYHFMNAAEPHLLEILQDRFDLTFTEAYPDLTADILKANDLVINYIDNWGERGTVATGIALQRFVAEGGQLLSMHSGIIQRDPFFLEQMQGATFTGHAEYTTLNYRRTEVVHPITEGVEPFSMGEEPYEFLLDPIAKKEVVFEFELNGKTYPAAWVLTYGLGRVIYLAPGHDARSFAVPGFRRLILNSALWLCPA